MRGEGEKAGGEKEEESERDITSSRCTVFRSTSSALEARMSLMYLMMSET